MKKIIIAITCAFLFSCGNNTNSNKSNADSISINSNSMEPDTGTQSTGTTGTGTVSDSGNAATPGSDGMHHKPSREDSSSIK